MMTLKDILETKLHKIVTIRKDYTVQAALEIMREKNVSGIFVVDEKEKLEGLFTERDIMHCVDSNMPLDTAIETVGMRELIKFDPSVELQSAISIASRKKIRHLPVVEGDKIVGMITFRDLVFSLLDASHLAALQRGRSLKVHLGCGEDRLDGYINVDYRRTRATDVTMDLNEPRFSPGSIAVVFSNAFFEHLFRNSRLRHLQRIYECLEPTGVCCYIGIPFFPTIAWFYLERGPGTAGPVFDLYNVYRYTHGDPEREPSWWLEKLHKSLFDEVEISSLLRGSGFTSFVLFGYGYPGDAHELPVTMGFYATRDSRPTAQLHEEAKAFLIQFADKKIRMPTLEWINEQAYPAR